ncbi:hypothetical protein RHMOL_Rhmol01G0052500 [Rhododendron molle]|uniref:Uncharacterized protein n=1 Tax=Rhododendron molle TaxID=49168 RepID=A0ACC0Q1J9_RHOML|nr:hypothetical protein RHMOL_Rhmol01G0052500 [Rhododendron molle]
MTILPLPLSLFLDLLSDLPLSLSLSLSAKLLPKTIQWLPPQFFTSVLPLTTTQTTTIESQPPIATPAFHAFISHITDTIRTSLSHRRPWTELVDRSAFSKPESLSESTLRIRKNYAYFRVNNLSCLTAVFAVSLLTKCQHNVQ